jgi:hypothetical protein
MEPLITYRKPGECCVLRGIVDNKIWLAQTVLVVKDSARETILLLVPGAECAFPEAYWRWQTKNDPDDCGRWQEARKNTIPLRRFDWLTNRLLIFLESGKYYSPMLFWDGATDEFRFYYINFQLPYRRSNCGFDTLDLDLDIVIQPDYCWEWKDVDDYVEGIREGGILPEWVREVEKGKEEVLERIARRAYPLDGSWNDWCPDAGWEPPKLPEDWDVL